MIHEFITLSTYQQKAKIITLSCTPWSHMFGGVLVSLNSPHIILSFVHVSSMALLKFLCVLPYCCVSISESTKILLRTSLVNWPMTTWYFVTTTTNESYQLCISCLHGNSLHTTGAQIHWYSWNPCNQIHIVK